MNRANRAKQLIVLSGKGGTGKTSLTAAFVALAGGTQPPVLVDADVDAANLSLVLQPRQSESHEFWGGSLAEIDTARCLGCGDCVTVCRYDAVLPDADHPPAYWIDPVACDGCAACVYICPHAAIRMIQQQEGHWFQSDTAYGRLFHAELFPGKENSGKLVTMIKQQARLWAEDHHAELVIIDGPPGIGCPVISACAGTDLGLIVTEPGLAGLHDLKRMLATLQHFRVPSVICINKADLYPQGTRQIREFAAQQAIEIIGEIPFDDHIPQAMLLGAPVTEQFPHAPCTPFIRAAWQQARQRLCEPEETT